jgi:hypothetical protein
MAVMLLGQFVALKGRTPTTFPEQQPAPSAHGYG